MRSFAVTCVLLVLCYLQLASAACDNRLAKSHSMPDGFCPFIYVEGLSQPRQITVASNNDIIVVERGKSQVTVIYDANGDGKLERAKLAAASGLNHAVVIQGDYLYASSASTVYRWKYTAGDRSDLGQAELVVHGIPTCCDHVTRTMVFDSKDRFYVQQGSGANVDPNITHSVIHRFELQKTIPSGGYWWFDGEVFAYGLRNDVGLRFDKEGRLWGVENGVDNLYRKDLGGDIHTNNPSEELNLFDPETPGKFYGYPYCWSQFNLKENHGMPIGTQWAYPEFMPKFTDEWCNNDTNVVKPALNMQAHYAPLGINFYYGNDWPSQYHGSAFVASHGSWDRNPPAGYRVLQIVFENGKPVKYEPFLYYEGPGETGSNWQRPVSIGFAKCAGYDECMLVTSDSTGVIIGIGYDK